MERPSHREITGKLKAAKEAIEKGYYLPADATKATVNLESLDLWGEDEIRKAFLDSISEITPDDYEGRRPPETSIEREVFGEEMFAFCWESKRFSKRMYLKFCIKKGTFYYISFHETKFR